MVKKSLPVEIPPGAENAEESVKCPRCGAMFGVGRQKDGEQVRCPVCQNQVSPAYAQRLEASNEGY